MGENRIQKSEVKASWSQPGFFYVANKMENFLKHQFTRVVFLSALKARTLPNQIIDCSGECDEMNEMKLKILGFLHSLLLPAIYLHSLKLFPVS